MRPDGRYEVVIGDGRHRTAECSELPEVALLKLLFEVVKFEVLIWRISTSRSLQAACRDNLATLKTQEVRKLKNHGASFSPIQLQSLQCRPIGSFDLDVYLVDWMHIVELLKKLLKLKHFSVPSLMLLLRFLKILKAR